MIDVFGNYKSPFEDRFEIILFENGIYQKTVTREMEYQANDVGEDWKRKGEYRSYKVRDTLQPI